MNKEHIIYLSILIPWALLSFLLHNAIHEGSHALAILAHGAKVRTIWLLPSFKLGYFTFAHIIWEGKLPDKQMLFVTTAPLVGETIWILICSIALGFTFVYGANLLLIGLLTIEVLYAIIDMTVWVLGWIRNRPHTDGGKTKRLLEKIRSENITI